MKNTRHPSTKIHQDRLEKVCVGFKVRLVVTVRNWPSLGINPDAPEYGLRDLGGQLLGTSRCKADLVTAAEERYLQVLDESAPAN